MNGAHLLEQCICGERSATPRIIHDLMMFECVACGVQRQWVTKTPGEVAEWYRTHYMGNAYTHSYEHDYAVAQKRLRAYALTGNGARLLDVGCGNAAFVNAARDNGFDAWGQDLSRDYECDHVYVGALEDVAFPTESFDVLTMHDVLEHHVNPRAMLRECHRVLKRPGRFFLDFPRFHHESGVHHWKPVEHLWMFNQAQLHDLVQSAGFRILRTSHPIPSKIVLELEKIPEARPSILVPPGIGDSLWSITKLPGFLRTKGLEGCIPDVWVQDSGGPRRTEPFLRNIPTIRAAGYKTLSDRDPVFHEAYMQDGRTVFEGIADCDYFIAYNGVMRYGKHLEDVDPEFGCEWRPKLHISKDAIAMRQRLEESGPYIVTYWAQAGMYRRWLHDFPPAQIIAALRQLEKEVKARIVFIGAPWDLGQIGRDIASTNPEWQDLIGRTSFDEMLGALMGATAVVGFPAGNTILATVCNRPTVLLWHKYFHTEFWRAACPPDAPYTPLDTEGLTPDRLVAEVQTLLSSNVA